MATYLTIVNNVLEVIGWSTLTPGSFSSPAQDSPAAGVKRHVNMAKDRVLSKLRYPFKEKEFAFETIQVHDNSNATNTTLTATAALSTIVIAGGDITADSTFKNRKVLVPASVNTSSNIDDSWYRVDSVSSQDLTVAATWTATWIATSSHGWKIFRDEYALDTSVRQVVSAWRGDSPLDLSFISEPRRHDVLEPGRVTIGDPTEVMVYRSPESGSIWEMQIHPVPRNPQLIHYKAKTWPVDLSAATDSWDLEPEIIGLIERATLQLTANSPLEADPELAISIGREVAVDIDAWADANRPRDPGRRRRRRGPDEAVPERSQTVRVAELS